MSQQRHYRLVHQRSTPSSIGRSKFQTTRQAEEALLRKPMLQRGMGFSGATSSGDAGSSHFKSESGTTESSFGEYMI